MSRCAVLLGFFCMLQSANRTVATYKQLIYVIALEVVNTAKLRPELLYFLAKKVVVYHTQQSENS